MTAGTRGPVLSQDCQLIEKLAHQNRAPIAERGVRGFAFSFINTKNERFWVKLHFKTMQGHKNWTNEEVEKVVGKAWRDGRFLLAAGTRTDTDLHGLGKLSPLSVSVRVGPAFRGRAIVTP